MDVGGFTSAADCIDDLIAEYAAQVGDWPTGD